MSGDLCIIKWKRYPSEFGGVLSKFVEKSSQYSELITLIKEIYSKEIKQFSGDIIDETDIVYFIDQAIKAVGESENKSYLLLAKSELGNILTTYNNKVVPNADFNLQQTDKLIPIVSADLNIQVQKHFNGAGFSIAYYDNEEGIRNPNDISTSIINYKNNLFVILQEYLGLEPIALYDNLTNLCEVDIYQDVMKKVWNKLETELDKDSKIFEGSIYNPNHAKLLSVIEAFYILNNFDTFIKNFSRKLITVNDTKFGTVNVSNDKYHLIEQHKQQSSFEGNHSDQDADKELSKIFKVFWENLQIAPGVYLTYKDLKKLTEYIKNSINEHHLNDDGNVKESKWLFLIDPTMQSFNMDINSKNLTDAIIHALRHDTALHKFLGGYGESICRAVADSFEKFKIHYTTFLNDNDLSIDEKAELERVMHLPRLFKQSVIEAENRVQVIYDENGNIKVTSDSRLSVSKEGLTYKITKSIKEHVDRMDFAVYSPTLNVDVRAMDLFSDRFLNLVNELTGLKLSKTQLERFCTSPEDTEKLFKFIDEFTHLVQSEIIAKLRFEEVRKNGLSDDVKNEIVERFFKILKRQGFYLDFSNLYVKENRNNVIKVLDSNGNPQPIQINPNTVQQFKKNLETFKTQAGNGANNNILVAYPGLTSPELHTDEQYSSSTHYREHIAYRQDVVYKNRGRSYVIKATEMSPEEILTTAFCGEFFDSIVNFGTFYNQIDCYSDKVTIALAAYNMHARVSINGETKQFMGLTPDELYNLWFAQKAGYYARVKQQITSDLQKVFGFDQTVSFDELIKHLETLDVDKFERMVTQYNVSHPGQEVDITQEIHYTKIEEKCAFNNTLYFNIKECELGGSKLKEYYDAGFNEFRRTLSSIRIPEKYRNKMFIESNKETLFELFNLDESDGIDSLLEFFGVRKNGEKTLDEVFWVQDNNPLSDTLIQKYFALQALSTDAELQITNKENLIHNGKVKQMPISLAYNENGNMSDEFYANVIKDQSERLIVGKKRNNAEVASYLPMDITSKYGVAPQSRFAIVKSKTQNLTNYNSQQTTQDVVDGSLETIGIAVEWENNSYPGKKVAGTKKVIGLVPTLTGFQQFKCADFPLDNLRILNSHDKTDDLGQSDSRSINVRLRAQKMMRTGTFTVNGGFYHAYANPENLSPLGVNIVKYFGNELMSLSSIKCIDINTRQFEFVWTSMNVDSNVTKTFNVEINNVCDLWEALGAEHTLEQNDGVWVPSNASMKAIALMISEYDPAVKTRMTSKLVDVSANKSGVTNINFAEDLDNPEIEGLNTTLIDNSRWGEQQDYSHLSDESHIPSLSQVISAVAFNGKNIKLVQDMYDALASLTMLKARELGIRYTNPDKKAKDEFYFHKRLVEKLMASLSTGATRSDALTLTREAKDAIDQIIALNHQNLGILSEDGALLPYSSPDIFYKLASDIISDLNKKSIRQTFNGIAIIQNPSHSVIGLYEDKFGKTYKKFDLLQLGRQIGVLPDKSPIDSETTDIQIIQAALSDDRFAPDQNVDVNTLELEDWVSFEYENDLGEIEIQTLRITNPIVLFEFEKGIYKPRNEKEKVLTKKNEFGQDIEISYKIVSGFTRLYGRSRDLKPPKVNFYTGLNIKGEPIGYQSLWLTEAVKNRYEIETRLSNLKDQLKEAESDGNVSEINRLSELIPEVQVELKKALQWYRANLEGLGNESNPYYYPTLTSFLNNDPVAAYYVTFEPGEQILPKVNKSAQMLSSNSLSDIRNAREGYFYGQAKFKFGKINDLSPLDKVNLTPQYKNEFQSILTVVRNSDEIVYLQFNHSDILQDWEVQNPNISVQDDVYYYQDESFNTLFTVPSKNSKVYKTTKDGKTIYYVVDETASNEQLEFAINNVKDINAVYESPVTKFYKYDSLLYTHNTIVDTTLGEAEIKQQFREYAEQLYKSFELSNYTISARIPSQSFQSFMANKTAAFMDTDQNDGYINIWEMWFQGSDYDIDKAYTMMYGLNKSGLIATISPIFDLSTHSLLTKSMQLPLPNKKSIITKGVDNISEKLLAIANKYAREVRTEEIKRKYLREPLPEELEEVHSDNLKSAFNWIKQLSTSKIVQSRLKYLDIIHEMIEEVNNTVNPQVSESDLNSGLIQLINKHNSFKVTAEGFKNKIMNTIYHCASDLKNLEASSQPMDSKTIKDLITEIEQERGKKKTVYNNINPFTKYQIQHENSVGKKNVGIAANGVKGAAAIQQYFNTYYQNWDGFELDENYKIDLDLQFHELIPGAEGVYRDIYTDKIFTVGDVVLTEDQFKKLAENKDFTQSSEYQAINTYLLNGSLPMGDIDIEREGLVKQRISYYRPNGKLLKSQYQDLISSWKLFVEHKAKQGIIVSSQNLSNYWVDFLYYKRQFNANVADMISIFISLATDNAKELVLARINATPELMSIPVTMLTLGMPPKQVLDICITCLDPIAKSLKYNRLQEAGTTNVRKLIANNNTDFDEVTKKSLLAIYDAAQEMRAITSFFKINQGLTAQYVELLGFYKNLAAILPQMISRKSGVSINDVEEPPINLEKLFSSKWKTEEKLKDRERYISGLKDNINKYKSAFNVINIVLENSNFSAMLEAMQLQLESIQFASGAASFVNIRSIISAEESEPLKTNDYRVLLRLYQDFIIGKTLQSEDFADIKFSLEDVAKSFGIESSSIKLPHKTNAQFGLNTEVGVENFIYLVEQIVIPRLKEKYGNNFFIRSLEEYKNKQLDKNSYQLMYDVFDDEDVAELQNIQNAIQDLRQIALHNSGLKTVLGQSINIGDIFYLYDMIVYKQRMSGLDMVVKSVANQLNSKFADIVNKMYIKYDEINRKDPKFAEEEFEELDLIQRSVLSGGSAIDKQTNLEITTKGKYIWTFSKPESNGETIGSLIEDYTSQNVIEDVEVFKSNIESSIVNIKIRIKNVPYSFIYSIDSSAIKNKLVKDIDLKLLPSSQEKLTQLRSKLEFYKYLSQRQENWAKKELSDFTEKLSEKPDKQLKDVLEKLFGNIENRIQILVRTNTKQNILSEPVQGYVQYNEGKVQSIVVLENSSIYELLDLILEVRCGSKDSKSKVIYLNKFLEGVSQGKQIRNNYLSYLSTVYPEKEIIQKCAGVQEFSDLYLSNKLEFYRNPTKIEKSEHRIELGDIVRFGNKKGIDFRSNFIYAGIIQGAHTFVNSRSGQIRRIDADTVSENNISGMTILYKLRVPYGYYPSEIKFISSGTVVDKNNCSIQEGDKITLSDGSEYIVSRVIYDLQEDGSYSEGYMINNNGSFFVIDSQHVQTVEKHKFNISTSFGLKNVYEVNSSFDSASSILKSLRKEDNIYVKNGDNVEAYPFEVYVDSQTIRAGGKYWKLSDIIAVDSYSQKYGDPNFEHDTRPTEVYVKQNSTLLQYLYFSKGWSPVNIKKQGVSDDQLSGYDRFNIKGNVTTFRLNDQLVYNLQGYTSVKQSIIQKEDIYMYFDGSEATEFIKIEDIKDGVYEVLIKKDNIYTLSYVTKETLQQYVQGWTHYSKKLLPDISNAKPIELSKMAQGYEVLNFLQEKIGLQLVFGDIEHAAEIRGNYLVINQKFDPQIAGNSVSIVNEALHEFTHIAIAMLRMKDSDTYVSMVNRFSGLLESLKEDENLKLIFDAIDKDNKHYPTQADKIEEKIVKYLDYYRNGPNNNVTIFTVSDLQKFIYNGFKELFGNSISMDSNKSLRWALSKYSSSSLFTDVTSGVNMLELAKREKRKHMLNRIIEKCF